MKNKNIGFAVTGSFCTLEKVLPFMEELVSSGNNVLPILSYSAAQFDSRFIGAEKLRKKIVDITGKQPIDTICDAEPIGPQNLLDIIIIAPCSGNTLAKLNCAITDTPVLMAAKAVLRNNKPVLIGISTNDGLSNNAKNIGEMLCKKNIYFVPFCQDDHINKCFSVVCDFSLVSAAAESALKGVQLQPVLLKK